MEGGKNILRWVKKISLKNMHLKLSNALVPIYISGLEQITHRSLVSMEKHKNQQYINVLAILNSKKGQKQSENELLVTRSDFTYFLKPSYYRIETRNLKNISIREDANFF